METVPVVRVKPWGKGQGDFVEINEKDFDPKVHTLLDPPKPAKGAEPAKAAAPAEPAKPADAPK